MKKRRRSGLSLAHRAGSGIIKLIYHRTGDRKVSEGVVPGALSWRHVSNLPSFMDKLETCPHERGQRRRQTPGARMWMSPTIPGGGMVPDTPQSDSSRL